MASLSMLSVHSSTMEVSDNREIKLLPEATFTHEPPAALKPLAMTMDQSNTEPTLDLSLSISLVNPPKMTPNNDAENLSNAEVLKKHVAEQVRLSAQERAYAERMRELTRRELELAEKEFMRARLVWERSREELEKVERMKMVATRRINSTCIQITCQACHQQFLS
ncbi:protein indeterminate-domain 16-like [Phalaenopsis equestris]|uniref:protein indeterminate-domain 16-like n=1 Tax=Phalaenopsis equestris TaxID=78828 RepID=UPI0009E2B800|nr:protein indeterminate-domain 16-like [Phalaenopsis equestris]